MADAVQHGPGMLWVIVGAAVCILAGLLAIGRGWSRYVLMGLGAASIVAVALSGARHTLVATAVLAASSLLLLAPRAHRYLSATRGPGPARAGSSRPTC